MPDKTKTVLKITLTAEERAEFEREARRAGLPLASWVRMAVLTRIRETEAD